MKTAPTRAFSWLKAPTSTSTFKTLLTTMLNRKYTWNWDTGTKIIHSQWALRIYANQTDCPLLPISFNLESHFHIFLLWVNACLAYFLNRFLYVKAPVGSFNQEKALVGAVSVIVKSSWTFVWRSMLLFSSRTFYLTHDGWWTALLLSKKIIAGI